MQFVNIVKNVNGGIFSVSLINELYHMKVPKIGIQIVQPQKDGKYSAAKSHLDVFEANRLIRGIRSINKVKPEDIMASYKGGPDKNYPDAQGQPKIISRVFRATRKIEKQSVILSVEFLDGERGYTKNKYGQQVPGIVKPRRGGQTYLKNSISLTRDEALYVSDAIERELAAWRTVMGSDYMHHPEKYRLNYNSQTQAPQGAPAMQAYPDDFPEDLFA